MIAIAFWSMEGAGRREDGCRTRGMVYRPREWRVKITASKSKRRGRRGDTVLKRCRLLDRRKAAVVSDGLVRRRLRPVSDYLRDLGSRQSSWRGARAHVRFLTARHSPRFAGIVPLRSK